MASVRDVQHLINQLFQGTPVGTKRRTVDLKYTALKLDNNPGHDTEVAIQKARYYLGVGHDDWRKNSKAITPELVRTLRDPFRRVKGFSKKENDHRREVASKRRGDRVERWKAARRPHWDGLMVVDGRTVVVLAGYWFLRARREGGWNIGILVSGYRTPIYSEGLCIHMCGNPTCPGRCAGRFTNHAKKTYPGPAMDVSNFTQFGVVQIRMGSPFKNRLPLDRVHFSQSGQ